MRTPAILFALLALPVTAAESPRVLTLATALDTAREHAPVLRQARATTGASQARAEGARAPLLPQASGAASYQRSTTNGASTSGQSPTRSGSSWDTSPTTALSVSASQLLWDFGASRSRWRAAVTSAASAQDSERAAEINVAAAVRNAFFVARATHGLVAVASETLANQEKHLTQVEAFVEVGTKPEIDLAQARADRANARVALINAENDYETAKASLNNVMGVEASTDYEVAEDSLPPLAGEDSAIDPLLDEALAARPDIAAAAADVRAQELSTRALTANLWPSVEASTGLSDIGPRVGDLTWNWNARILVSVPILTGGQNRAQIREANWNLEGLKARAEALRQQVRLALEQARLGVRAALASVEASSEALVNSQELLRLAEGRYEAGVGTIIELGDAQLALTAAAQQKVKADYTLAQARSALLQALGRA
jgi:outer membrane protein